MRFLINSPDIACVETHQVNEDEVQILLDNEVVSYFDSDENELVVFQDVLKNNQVSFHAGAFSPPFDLIYR